ncbi:hypothetical protein GCM10023212_37090 [Luteolibacter yonseiensis]
MTQDTKELLRDYTRNRSEDAFRVLVREHSPVVYGTALRKLGGDRAAAQDVTQEVFTLLARKAHRLESVVLGGWLYRQACRRAANHARSEARRKKRESIAMENQNHPSPADGFLAKELDDALLALPEKDRDALILRFFEDKEFKVLGTTLGLSEEAARKRVTRALERLAENLKRRGVPVGSVSLGTAMQGFGATPVPAAVISQVSRTAFQAGAGGGWTVCISLLKPIAAGVATVSLVAGSTLAFRSGNADEASAEAVAPQVAARGPRSSRFAEKLPEHLTLEQIIAEIRRIRSGPGTVLTELRMQVVLGKIQVSQIPEFVLLGNRELNQDEREEIYRPLLTLWWDRDPETAMTFILKERIDAKTSGQDSHYLVGELYRRWAERDRKAAEAWLARNWEDEVLAKKHGNGKFRNFLSMWITGEFFSHGDIDGLFAFSRRMPTIDDQAGALFNIVGMAPMHSMFNYSGKNQDRWRRFHRGLEQFPDDRWRSELVRQFWKNIGEHHADDVRTIQESFQPADPFAASLGLLSVKKRLARRTDSSGMTSYESTPVSDRSEREADSMAIGLAQGLTRGQVLTAMGRALPEGMKKEDYFAWVDSHRDELELDDFFLRQAMEKGIDGQVRGRQPEAIEWASRITDTELRRKACRAIFRRYRAGNPEWAAKYLAEGKMPQDLAEEFQLIANSAP